MKWLTRDDLNFQAVCKLIAKYIYPLLTSKLYKFTIQ